MGSKAVALAVVPSRITVALGVMGNVRGKAAPILDPPIELGPDLFSVYTRVIVGAGSRDRFLSDMRPESVMVLVSITSDGTRLRSNLNSTPDSVHVSFQNTVIWMY